MQLTYRGVVYPASHTNVYKVNTKLGLTYRGQTYNHCRAISVAGLPQRNLSYRGVAYRAKTLLISPVISDRNDLN
ncbi:DUF4278 domain-containing protein [Gloeothece verrucosa]|uniref:DUF4278 domain-containing protein n=1 Tax=Gloeothece verrucosa (strain PCC 7822) TaxID=497965 RepID=E0U9Q7_GLOV7|nr:DUF4278 domain-containing protein [Gloeothece verrucosa]ADN13858.1 hypothetical protein Cyan7822_1874 [Gloeothece verrucosa PCC 7822]